MNKEMNSRCLICAKEEPFTLSQTTCAGCGGNLDVRYDLPTLRKTITRQSLRANDDYSLWRYSDLLPLEPGLRRPTLNVGWTPLVPAPRLGEVLGHADLLLKDEGRNPSGSLKDRASATVLLGAIANGSKRIVGASTGNAGSSMACLSANAGLDCTILVPADAPAAKVSQLLAFGAQVLPIRGSYDQAFDLSLAVSERYGWYNRSTGYNPLTREGKKTCAFEICEQLDFKVPDWVFVAVGDGNIISGLHKGFQELRELQVVERAPRLVAVQSTGSNAVAAALARAGDRGITPPDEICITPVSASTRADSISVDLPRDGVAAVRAVQESGGYAVEVDDAEILGFIETVARHSGVFGEPAAVASVAGFAAAVKKGAIAPSESVVCVITGNGLKDAAAVTSVSRAPVAIEPSLDQVCRFLQE